MIHSTIGLIHTIAALVAMLLGAWLFLRSKAGVQHRLGGYIYTVSMLILISTALLIYRLTDSFNLLHVFALVSTGTLGRALYHAIARKPKDKWLEHHYEWMSWSYIGLLAAFVAEMATRWLVKVLYIHYGVRSFGWFWTTVIIVMFCICFFGAVMVERNRQITKRYALSR